MAQRQTIFRAFKYTIYALLAMNVGWFFLEDFNASAQTFANGVTWRNFVEAYSSTVDTLAWVVLLLLFELETAVISDERLRGNLKYWLAAIRLVCYFFITYAFFGYLGKFFLVTNVADLGVVDLCRQLGTEAASIVSLDDYIPLTQTSCAQLSAAPVFQVAETQIYGSAADMSLLRNLATTDVVNSGDWLVIVALLEIEVVMQLRGLLSDRWIGLFKKVKAVLYTILFACALYWWLDGDFLDFWDAFLWLVAFIFIELNIFQWQAESKEENHPQVEAQA